MRLISILVAAASLHACKSTPRPAPEAALVEGADELGVDGDAVCAAAKWTDAMACADASCVAEAAGAACVECVTATLACVDGRSSGCEAACVECLGSERCRFIENVAIAATHLEPVADRGYVGDAATAYRIGEQAVQLLYAATEDSLRVQSITPQDGFNAGPYDLGKVQVDAEGKVLRTWNDGCDITPSPGGRWLALQCTDVVRVVELRTGFVRFEIEAGSKRRRPPGPVFGGDRVLAVEQPDSNWVVLDLRSGAVAPLRGVEEHFDGNDLRLSPDGEYAATVGFTKVWPLGNAPAVEWTETDATGEFEWIDASTVLVATGDVIRLLSFPDWRPLRAVTAPPYEQEGFQAHWRLQVVGGAVVHAGNTPRGPLVKWGDETAEPALPLHGYSLGQILLRRVDGLDRSPNVVPGDEAVFMTKLGPLAWSPDRGLRNPHALRGDLLWDAPGGPHELLVGMSTGAASVDLRTGEHTDLKLPPDYRLIGVRRAGDVLVALGSRPGDEQCERRRSVLIRRDGREEVVELEKEPLVATLDTEGRLQVIDESGLRTYAAGKLVKTSKQHEFRSFGNQGPPRALPMQGLLSFDGTRALFPQQGKATLIRASDHKVLASFSAKSCAFARRSSVFACIESRGEGGEVEIVAYDANGKAIGGMEAIISQGEVMEVSDDGERVITGDVLFQRASAVWDLDRATLHDLPFGTSRHAFHSDGRLIAVGPTYVELFDGIPPARE